MKKIVLYLFIAAGAYLAYIAISLALTPPVSDLADKKFSTTIQVRDYPTINFGRPSRICKL